MTQKVSAFMRVLGALEVLTANINDLAVTTGKLAAGAVTGGKIAMTSDVWGDILYRGTAVYQRLAAGTAGFILSSGGAGAAPVWVNSPRVALERIVGAQTSYDFATGIDGTYRSYVIEGWMQPVTDDRELWMRTSSDAGVSYDATVNDYHYAASGMLNVAAQDNQSVTVASITVAGNTAAGAGVGNAADERAKVIIRFDAPDGAAFRQLFLYNSVCIISTGGINVLNGGAFRDGTGIVDAVRLLFESGNVADGDVTLYGIF